jgi:hypothetical protein
MVKYRPERIDYTNWFSVNHILYLNTLLVGMVDFIKNVPQIFKRKAVRA